jgi:hypothetical protein
MFKQVFTFLFFCSYSSEVLNAQVKLDAFFKAVHKVVNSEFVKNDLDGIEKFKDNVVTTTTSKKIIDNTSIRASGIKIGQAEISFSFFISVLKNIPDTKSSGEIFIDYELDSIALKQEIDVLITKYKMNFDIKSVINDTLCKCKKLYLHFNNYSPKTNVVISHFETPFRDSLKHEYFDFYFNDIDTKTSRWQKRFRDFMQPYSDVLITLVRSKNIKAVFELIALKNLGYSWSLAEGLWYYNSLVPCLSKRQLAIINSYNGKRGMISFRPKEELSKIYKF